jgi:antitoxin component YwqK of YwqJK toxin-antitoxin module
MEIFYPQNKIKQIENPNAVNEDGINKIEYNNNHDESIETFRDGIAYEVVSAEVLLPAFILSPMKSNTSNKVLKPGDVVKFEAF